MTLQAVIVVLACLVCTGLTRKIRGASYQADSATSSPDLHTRDSLAQSEFKQQELWGRQSNALAKLLLSLNPTTAFNPSSPGVRFPAGTSLRASSRVSSPVAFDGLPTELLAAAPGDLWSSYLNLLETAPLQTKAITAGIIIGAGDSTAQLIESARSEENQEFDVARALRWAVFGLVLQGPWNHFFYLLLDGALPPTPDPWTLLTLEKVTIDQFIQAPIFTIIILCFFAVVEGKGLDFAKSQVQNDLGGILVKNWGVFLPATVINLAFCPPALRVLFLNTVFFGWVCYLSLFLNADDEGNAKDAKA